MKAALPGLESLVRDNPAYGKAAMEAIGGKMRDDPQLAGVGNMISKMFGNMGGNGGQPSGPPPPAATAPPPRMAAPAPARREMRGPSNYDEILGGLNAFSQ